MSRKAPKHESLTRITRMMTILALCSLWIFLIMYAVMEYRFTRSEFEEEISLLALSASNQAESVFSSTKSMLSTIDTWIAGNPDEDPFTNRDLCAIIDNFREQSAYTIDIRFVSESGGLFYVPQKSSQPLADVSDREYFKVQRNTATKGFFIAEPIKSRVTHLWGIPVSYPVFSKRSGNIVVFAAIELPSLEKYIKDILPESEATITLIRNDGVFLTRIPFDESYPGRHIENFEEAFIPANQSGVFTSRTEHTSYLNKIIAYRKLHSFPVFVTVSKEFDSFFSLWISRVIFPIVAGVLFSAVILFLFRRFEFFSKELGISRRLLENEARFDALTGLFNRKYFFSRIEEETERSARTRSSLILILCDLDFFKQINDRFGHPTGDIVLQQTGQVIRSSIRKNDLAGRVGGEEFAILLSDATDEIAASVSSRILEGINGISLPDGTTGISIGIAVRSNINERIESWYKRADDALYQAKREGRNHFVFYSPKKSEE